MRAVLDANVVIAALLSSSGAPAALIRAWLGGAFELIVSEHLLLELERALAYPKLRSRVSASEAADVVLFLRRHAELKPDPPLSEVRSSDPGDDYLIALAQSTHSALVSGDRHLLDLSDSFPVYAPRAFLALLEEQP